jgi:ubiquinone/menaquinone biosynthesis C-methylase UbiE
MLPWIIGIVVVVVVLYLLDREIYFYEGAHLGPRAQGWEYDRWAAKYDAGKHASQQQDADVLARPLVDKLRGDQPQPPAVLLLDVATGTGRLPLALLNDLDFKGQIIALDLSRKMLEQAAIKLAAHPDRVTLLRHSALPLPFPDACFDVVSCLEALELMPDLETPLAELSRVLRPGGILITTRGTEASGRVNKIVAADRFAALLQAAGFEQIEIIPWWKNFDRVWARQPGTLAPAGPRPIHEVLRCSACGQVALIPQPDGSLRCDSCRAVISVSPEGIVLG